MKTITIAWVIAVLVILGIGWYFFSSDSPALSPTQNIAVGDLPNSETAAIPSEGVPTKPAASVPLAVTVVYGPNGFSPSTVTVAEGGTVTFTNQGAGAMWIATNLHPTHEGYDGTTKNQHCPDTAGVAFDQCSVGTSYSFTFKKTGIWDYHNHANAGDGGVVIVK